MIHKCNKFQFELMFPPYIQQCLETRKILRRPSWGTKKVYFIWFFLKLLFPLLFSVCLRQLSYILHYHHFFLHLFLQSYFYIYNIYIKVLNWFFVNSRVEKKVVRTVVDEWNLGCLFAIVILFSFIFSRCYFHFSTIYTFDSFHFF